MLKKEDRIFTNLYNEIEMIGVEQRKFFQKTETGL